MRAPLPALRSLLVSLWRRSPGLVVVGGLTLLALAIRTLPRATPKPARSSEPPAASSECPPRTLRDSNVCVPAPDPGAAVSNGQRSTQ